MSERAEADQRILKQALEQNMEIYRLLAENISDVIWILDVDSMRFRYVSSSVKNMLGFTVEELMAIDVSAAFTAESYQLLQQLTPARVQDFHQGQHLHYVDELAQRCKDGSVVWLEVTSSFVMNSSSGHLEIFGVSRDITERKRNEALLRLRLELLEHAPGLSLAQLMQFALDKIAAFSDSAIGFYHFVQADQRTLSLQAWSTRTLDEFCRTDGTDMHYDIDEAGVWVECVRQRKPVIHNHYPSLEGRKGLPPGHAALIRELVVPVYRGEKIVSILGVGNKPTDYTEKDVENVSYLADVVWEIVKRKQAEETLSELQAGLQLLSQNLVDAGLYIYAHNIEGRPRFEYLSAGVETLTGVKIEDALRDASAIHALILPEYRQQLMRMEEISKRDLQGFEMELRQKHAVSGEIRWMLLRSTPRRREDGSTVWYGVQMDITERKQSEYLLEEANTQLRVHMQEIEELQDVLREQSLRDPLTGLYNRRYLAETLEREIALAQREGKQLSILISDIDHFKTINDTYGHRVGDQILIQIANLIRHHARRSDMVCRYGGEEFLLVLPETGLGGAIQRAEELRQKVAALTHRPDGEALNVSISIGVATFPHHGQGADEIIIKADQALYISKETGRNRVTASPLH